MRILTKCKHCSISESSTDALRVKIFLSWLQALSVTLRRQTLDSALRNVRRLKDAVDKCKATDAERLRGEYQRLIGGLQVQTVKTGACLSRHWQPKSL
jgi:hypothetical protein